MVNLKFVLIIHVSSRISFFQITQLKECAFCYMPVVKCHLVKSDNAINNAFSLFFFFFLVFFPFFFPSYLSRNIFTDFDVVQDKNDARRADKRI